MASSPPLPNRRICLNRYFIMIIWNGPGLLIMRMCVLWDELGTKEQYDEQYGKTPLGELVRSIVGLDQKAANEAFSRFLNDAEIDSRQMYFVRQIVNYIVKNGIRKYTFL